MTALAEKLNLDDGSIFWDDEGLGCIGNALRAWSAPLKPDETHLLVLNDDADVIDNFTEIVHKCIEHFPVAIFGFWSNQLRYEHKTKDSPYIMMKNHNVKGIAFMMPKRYIEGYLKFYDDNLRRLNYQHDDATCRMYAFLNDIPVFSTIPSLVEELLPQDSSISRTHNSANNYSRVWEGRQRIDPAMFDTKEYSISPAFSINTHLKKDDPLQVKIREKMQRRKGMIVHR